MKIPTGFLFAATVLCAQPSFLPRTDYAARLEPRGMIQHGAGQDPSAFARYAEVMPAQSKPIIYMAYISLKDLRPDWADDLRRRLPLELSSFAALQIGLSMTADGRPEDAYEDRVAAGELDPQIGNLVSGLTALALPVYLRIGYEFNGLSWNGYRPEPYKAAFRRIASAIRESRPELEVATVWCAAMDGTRNFEEFYPGDDVVDWYGIDIFSARHFDDPDVARFVSSAEARQKPLLLGETTPRGEGAQVAAAWNAWFEPLFRWMAATPQLKQFNYINWNWAERGRALNQPNWINWGDARLETQEAEPVRIRYTDLLSAAVFQHATGEIEFRRSLGLTEDQPPTPPRDLSLAGNAVGGLGLAWASLEESPGFQLARYYIHRDGHLLGFSHSPKFLDESARAGVEATYQVALMSRAGTLTEASEPLTVKPDRIIRCADGFDDGLPGAWRLDSFHPNARGESEFDDGAVKLALAQSSGTGWHLQFRRFVQLNAGHRYHLAVRARATAAVLLPLWLQQDGGANTVYHNRSLALTTEWTTFEFEFPAPATARSAAAFILGNLPAGTSIFIDNVELIELPA
jgi:hypothetical protein